jgi:chromosome segregation ATPase
MAARKKTNVRDVTNTILRRIHDEIRATRTELTERIDQTNARLDVHERVLERLVDVAERTHEQLGTHEQVLVKLVRAVERLDARMDNLTGAHREEHDALRSRLDRLEQKVG